MQALHPYKPLTIIPINTNSNAIALQSSTNAKSDRFCLEVAMAFANRFPLLIYK
ncbi:MAG: hypothetical protein AB4426_16630 [Xenococcaceae cyanobacterium]